MSGNRLSANMSLILNWLSDYIFHKRKSFIFYDRYNITLTLFYPRGSKCIFFTASSQLIFLTPIFPTSQIKYISGSELYMVFMNFISVLLIAIKGNFAWPCNDHANEMSFFFFLHWSCTVLFPPGGLGCSHVVSFPKGTISANLYIFYCHRPCCG